MQKVYGAHLPDKFIVLSHPDELGAPGYRDVEGVYTKTGSGLCRICGTGLEMEDLDSVVFKEERTIECENCGWYFECGRPQGVYQDWSNAMDIVKTQETITNYTQADMPFTIDQVKKISERENRKGEIYLLIYLETGDQWAAGTPGFVKRCGVYWQVPNRARNYRSAVGALRAYAPEGDTMAE